MAKLQMYTSVNDLNQCITKAVASVDEDMLWCVWSKLDCCIDICHDKRLIHRTFVTLSYKLEDMY
jgi:hypothetical protein